MPISPIPIDYNLIAQLGSSYNDQQLKAQKLQEMEQERLVRALQMQELAFKVSEQKRQRQYEMGMQPYLESQKSDLLQQRGNLAPPEQKLLGEINVQQPVVAPQGPPGSVGSLTSKPTGEYRQSVEEFYQQPSPQDLLNYEKKAVETTFNQYEAMRDYALKSGKMEDALKYDRLALTGKFRKIDSLLEVAQRNGDEAMSNELLRQRAGLEREASLSEGKYTDLIAKSQQMAFDRNKMTQRGIATINGKDYTYATNARGQGFIQDPNTMAWQAVSYTGQLKPLTTPAESQGTDAQWIREFEARGLTHLQALQALRAQKQADSLAIARMRIPDIRPIAGAPPGFQQQQRAEGDPTQTNVYFLGHQVPANILAKYPLDVISSNYKANQASQAQIVRFYDVTQQAVRQAENNLKEVQRTSKEFVRFGIPAPNKVYNWVAKNLGTAEQQKKLGEFKTAVVAFAREYMRVVSNAARSSQELTDKSKDMADELFATSDSWVALEAKINQAATEMKNTTYSYQDQIREVQDRIAADPWRTHFIPDNVKAYLEGNGPLAPPRAEDGPGKPTTSPPPLTMIPKEGDRKVDPVTGEYWQNVGGVPKFMGKASPWTRRR
jgi:hypothetical protein